MSALLIGLALSGGLFFLSAIIVVIEERRGHRVLARQMRDALDRGITRSTVSIGAWWHHVVHRVITLSWYYSLHAFLKVCLRFIAGIYEAVEQLFIKNRNKARQIRRERRQSHLTTLNEHKIETTLSEAEKKRVKTKALNS